MRIASSFHDPMLTAPEDGADLLQNRSKRSPPISGRRRCPKGSSPKSQPRHLYVEQPNGRRNRADDLSSVGVSYGGRPWSMMPLAPAH